MILSDELISIHNLVEVVVTVLDARDPYTHVHSWRVAEIAECLAYGFNLEKEWLNRIHIAAHLHDIGKIGVPDAILNKNGRLTVEEFSIRKSHSVIGSTIINKIPVLKDISLYIRHHHERFDGKGYPDGLVGKNIPFGSRIIAVADTFDAITSHRHYRPARSIEESFKEIRSCSGTQLCPECVTCFMDMKKNILHLIERVNAELLRKTVSLLPSVVEEQ